MSFLIVWEFSVPPGQIAAFERAYGPRGAWAELFSAASGYRGTELLKDPEKPGRYFTVDRWESEEAFHTFRAAHEDDYQRLDAACASLTASEVKLGTFLAPDP